MRILDQPLMTKGKLANTILLSTTDRSYLTDFIGSLQNDEGVVRPSSTQIDVRPVSSDSSSESRAVWMRCSVSSTSVSHSHQQVERMSQNAFSVSCNLSNNDVMDVLSTSLIMRFLLKDTLSPFVSKINEHSSITTYSVPVMLLPTSILSKRSREKELDPLLMA